MFEAFVKEIDSYTPCRPGMSNSFYKARFVFMWAAPVKLQCQCKMFNYAFNQ